MKMSLFLFRLLFALPPGAAARQGAPSVRQAGASRIFRAGAAASNITPPLGALIVGGWKPVPATLKILNWEKL